MPFSEGIVAKLEIGVVLPIGQVGSGRATTGWEDIRAIALRAEETGFDTVWAIDELYWKPKARAAHGFWDGVSMAGAIAASTSTVKVGTWVLSALHRNPGIIAKTVETLDEISGGRMVFGLGAGHANPGQAHAFGLPEENVFARFDEALQVIVPLLRTGHADFEGKYHAARGLRQEPQGPRPGKIPLMIGGNFPKAQRHAVRHADIWSAYVQDSVAELPGRIESLEAICVEEGRDASSIRRSVGVIANPTLPVGAQADAVSGTPRQMADALREMLDVGFDQVELMLDPGTLDAFEALAPVANLLKAGT